MNRIIQEISAACKKLSWSDFSKFDDLQNREVDMLELKIDFMEKNSVEISVYEAIELLKNMPFGIDADYLESRITDLVYESGAFPFREIWDLYPSNSHLDELKYTILDNGIHPCTFSFADIVICDVKDISILMRKVKRNVNKIDCESDASNILTLLFISDEEDSVFDEDFDIAILNMAKRFPLIFENYLTGSSVLEDSARDRGLTQFCTFLVNHSSYDPFGHGHRDHTSVIRGTLDGKSGNKSLH